MMIKKVIDISKYQGLVNMDKVKASGVEGVIIRAGYGKSESQVDPYFESNYFNAKRAGLHVGAYWYSYTDTVKGAREEALTCLSVIAGKCFDLPIYYDVEEKDQLTKGPQFLSGIIEEFCNYLERSGCFVGLYMSAAHLKAVPMRTLVKYTIWVAQWGDKLTYNLTKPGMWQYTSAGTVDGITGPVDLDYMFIDYPTIIRGAHLNGYNSIYNMETLEAAVTNETDLAILYECKAQLERLRDKYI